MIDRVVSTVVALGSSTCVQPRLVFDERSTMFKMVNAVRCFYPLLDRLI